MGLGYDVSVWERYATELALAIGDTATRIAAVGTAYFDHGFDVDFISDASGFPVWRVRQAIRDAAAKPRPEA